jgi:hypothetical protein
MTLVSSRLAIAQAIVALVKTIQNPATSQPLYQLVKLGAVFDASPFNAWCEVTHYQGKGGPAGSGGNMIGWLTSEDVTFQITSGFGPYEKDSTAAQTAMLATQDILLPTLRQHFKLPDANDPTNAVQSGYSLLVEQVDRSQPVKFPSGSVFLLWHVFVTVKQQYTIELQIP